MKKSIKLHISPKPYQWFEVATEDEFISDGSKSYESFSNDCFEVIKKIAFNDAVSVLNDIGCPLSDEKLKEFEQTLSEKTTPKLDNNTVTVSLAKKIDANDSALDVGDILGDFTSEFPNIN
jgi:hypothetical protein